MSNPALTGEPPHLRAAGLAALPGLRHAFFAALGGVSEGCYASLNTGYSTDDASANVTENRRRCLAALGLPAPALATARQVHGTAVVAPDAGDGLAERPAADALVTTRPGLAVGVLTADCVPVLLADRQGRAVMALHAGWRGALGGVVEAGIAALAARGCAAADVVAALGPAIAARHYQVSRGFEAPFLAAQPDDADLFTPDPGAAAKLRFDLPGYVRRCLARAGVAIIEGPAADTYTDTRFFSSRRSRADGARDFGRNLAAIALAPA